MQNALAFVEATVLAMHLAEHLTRAEREARGLEELLDQLTMIEPASRPAWVVLGRLARHIVSAFEDTGDWLLVLAIELQNEVMAHVDAVHARQKGSG